MPRDHGRHDRDAWGSASWDDDPRPHRGLVSRVVSLFKLSLVLAPLAMFAASYLVTDCGSRAGSGLGQVFKAGACARNEILSGALSLPSDLGLLRRAID